MLIKRAKSFARGLAAYTGPHRWRGAPRLWILTYHRILPSHDRRTELEEPGMLVTPETFRNHMLWISELFEILALSEWVRRRNEGLPLPGRACAVTFDDGWRDNYEFAFPILVENEIPATIFTVSAFVGTTEQFWPNRLIRLLLHAGPAAREAATLSWLAELGFETAAKTLTRNDCVRAISLAKRLPERELVELLARAEAAVGLGPSNTRSLLSWHELSEMVESGIVEVGSHTCTHTRLNSQTQEATVTNEVVESRAQLQAALDRPVSLFCYPNGDMTPYAKDLVQQHYAAAVTTRRGINTKSTPLHELNRIGVHEDVSARRRDFLARLSGWV